MSVEEKPENKSSPTEMAPQEDGTKVLLNKEQADGAAVQQAKFVANPNGDAKIDIGSAPAFAGLTKDELMKYSTDPFWVRLRWILFILFWIGWVAMLAMAIVIIVQAPGCEPPPVLLWVEEKPMLEVDPNNLPSETELMKQMDDLGISSVYLPNLISEDDFSLSNYDVETILNSLETGKKMGVTDLPSRIRSYNPLHDNATQSGFIDGNGFFDYSIEGLPSAFAKSILSTWIEKGVKGFLMKEKETPEIKKFLEELNLLLEEKNGAVGSEIEEITPRDILPASKFEPFLQEHAGNWTFFRFKAAYEASSLTSEDDLRLMLFGLFLSEGTPILHDSLSLSNSSSMIIKELNKLRIMDGIKFGETNFANTSVTSLAFSRAYKGTPAYAVALNFNDEPDVISFKGSPYIADDGTIELRSGQGGQLSTDSTEKIDLSEIVLGPKEGIAIQFVAVFS